MCTLSILGYTLFLTECWRVWSITAFRGGQHWRRWVIISRLPWTVASEHKIWRLRRTDSVWVNIIVGPIRSTSVVFYICILNLVWQVIFKWFMIINEFRLHMYLRIYSFCCNTPKFSHPKFPNQLRNECLIAMFMMLSKGSKVSALKVTELGSYTSSTGSRWWVSLAGQYCNDSELSLQVLK